jgi:hypothetical protein
LQIHGEHPIHRGTFALVFASVDTYYLCLEAQGDQFWRLFLNNEITDNRSEPPIFSVNKNDGDRWTMCSYRQADAFRK